jgi:hypothetical protein
MAYLDIILLWPLAFCKLTFNFQWWQYFSNIAKADLHISKSFRPKLGVIFNYNGCFVMARAKLMDQARKTLYCLYRKLRNISIPIDLQFKLFDTLILPILTFFYFLLQNIITLVFCKLTFNFQWWQYFSNIAKADLHISKSFHPKLVGLCVYTLLENSLYSSINAFLDIENELVNFIEKDMKCALVGDFNAKTVFFWRFFQNQMKLFWKLWM